MLSESLIGTIIGGIIGFFSAIGADLIKNWIDQARIEIKEETIEEKEPLKYSKTNPKIASSDIQDFERIRIKVQNDRRTAAQDCKATLVVSKNDYRIAWVIAREDSTVIINAHDTEIIDLCAISKVNK